MITEIRVWTENGRDWLYRLSQRRPDATGDDTELYRCPSTRHSREQAMRDAEHLADCCDKASAGYQGVTARNGLSVPPTALGMVESVLPDAPMLCPSVSTADDNPNHPTECAGTRPLAANQAPSSNHYPTG